MGQSEAKVSQIIPLDNSGLRKNVSELLQAIHSKNIKSVFISYMRNDPESSVRTYSYSTDRAKYNLLLDIAKHDLLESLYEGDEVRMYPDDEDEE